jgi:hypothetical protein
MDVLAPANRASGWMLKLAIECFTVFVIACALVWRIAIKLSHCGVETFRGCLAL